jgi:Domain of unknown function (DUF1843)
MPEEQSTRQVQIKVYGVPMRDAAAKGDLAEMKALAAQAQQHLAEHGDVSAALEVLKLEIAKLEASGR